MHDNKNNFIPCARYSNNPELQKKGKVEYPDNQGCISKAWQHDWCFDNNFDSSADYAQYNLDTYKIPKLTTRQMKMKSHLYAVKRIKNEYGKPLAVIVVESLEKNFFKEDEIKTQLGQAEGFFAHIIEQLWDHIPKPMDAKQRGL